MLLAQAITGGQGAVGQAVVLRQLILLTQAVYAMHHATHEARRTREIRTVAEARLREVINRLPPVPEPMPAGARPDASTTEATRVAATGQMPARPLGSPVPNRIERARHHKTSTPGTARGPER